MKYPFTDYPSVWQKHEDDIEEWCFIGDHDESGSRFNQIISVRDWFNEHRSTFLIVKGQSKIGKSSLIKYALKEIDCIKINIQDLDVDELTGEALLVFICQKILEAEFGEDDTLLPVIDINDARSKLTHVLRQKSVVLLMSDQILVNEKASLISFINEIKRKIGNDKKLRFVGEYSGSNTPSASIVNSIQKKLFEPSCEAIELAPFNDKEVESLILGQDAQKWKKPSYLDFPNFDTLLEEIKNWAGRHPYFLQAVCATINSCYQFKNPHTDRVQQTVQSCITYRLNGDFIEFNSILSSYCDAVREIRKKHTNELDALQEIKSLYEEAGILTSKNTIIKLIELKMEKKMDPITEVLKAISVSVVKNTIERWWNNSIPAKSVFAASLEEAIKEKESLRNKLNLPEPDVDTTIKYMEAKGNLALVKDQNAFYEQVKKDLKNSMNNPPDTGLADYVDQVVNLAKAKYMNLVSEGDLNAKKEFEMLVTRHVLRDTGKSGFEQVEPTAEKISEEVFLIPERTQPASIVTSTSPQFKKARQDAIDAFVEYKKKEARKTEVVNEIDDKQRRINAQNGLPERLRFPPEELNQIKEDLKNLKEEIRDVTREYEETYVVYSEKYNLFLRIENGG